MQFVICVKATQSVDVDFFRFFVNYKPGAASLCILIFHTLALRKVRH